MISFIQSNILQFALDDSDDDEYIVEEELKDEDSNNPYEEDKIEEIIKQLESQEIEKKKPSKAAKLLDLNDDIESIEDSGDENFVEPTSWVSKQPNPFASVQFKFIDEYLEAVKFIT
jgi:actin-related protein